MTYFDYDYKKEIEFCKANLPGLDWVKENFESDFDNDYRSLESFCFRRYYISEISFPLLCKEWVEDLVKYLNRKRVIEVGCGIGYLSYKIISSENY